MIISFFSVPLRLHETVLEIHGTTMVCHLVAISSSIAICQYFVVYSCFVASSTSYTMSTACPSCKLSNYFDLLLSKRYLKFFIEFFFS